MAKRSTFLTQASIAAVLLGSSMAQAADISVSGFIRQETAFKISGQENPMNQQGNIYNGVLTDRDASAFAGLLGVPPEFLQIPVARAVDSQNNFFNLNATRVEIDVQAKFSENLTGFAKFRGFFDWGLYKDFERPNFFETPLYGNSGTMLEVTGRNYMIDIPALYLDYSNGPLWIRAGNQQIAWGEAIFFRVLDVPNGLDLRRHLTLDLAAEEYSDKRVPSPAIRASYNLNDDWEFEAFIQKFSPSILPNPSTPYNIIADAFTVHQRDQFDAVDDSWNYGARLRGQIGELGLQFVFMQRRNPDGVFRWTASGVNRDLPGVPGSGFVLENTAFEVDPTGINSAAEWYEYAAMVRLDAIQGFNAAIDDFQPWTGLLDALNVDTLAAIFGGTADFWAHQELDLFFQLSGGMRGHIERLYPKETILGAGMNYMFFSDPGSWLDQLVVRVEAAYTPNKNFTNITLGQEFIEKDEWTASLVLEKYHRFSENFPATFMVLQWLHRSESDMFGRHLSGMGGDLNNTPTGNKSFDAVAFAMQQPFPNLIWRFDLTILYDLQGGVLVQPALRWKPNSEWTVELFANILEGKGNDNIITSVEYADEVTLRVGYQF